ncbi:phage capsid protein [Kitasatospora sp. NBC_01300]|uniref:phage capsid protein n=1 Tax=Kitasatospora sp. NBC_01300 TaxID=2903574 RepID=UPI00352C6C28|nr:phage portal protein [Kitasatospora sp. NBC_01300]
MPLPDANSPWPPRRWAPELAEMAVDDAWYSGDPRRLAAVYQGQSHRQDGRRRLWGRDRTPDPGRREHRLHIPMPADVARRSAGLLFSEPPRLTVGDTALQARLDELLGEHAERVLLEAAEVSAALGGVYLVAAWDAELGPRPLLTTVHADAALPEFRHGYLTAVTCWEELARTGATVLRRLERHERGRIEHALYEGTPDNIGRPVPLTEHPTTAAVVDSLGPSGAIETGIPQLTAAYWPNIGPNRSHRGSPLGRSDLQGPGRDLCDALDETWSSWMRDIRLARGRLIVPAAYLRDRGPGRGATFDEDREVWQALDIPPTEAGAGITLAQFAIRVAEHKSTSDAVVRQIIEAAGYSPSTFGLDGGGPAATATEIEARDRDSMVTRKAKTRYAGPALADIVEAMLQLDRALGWSRLTPERPHVAFGPAVARDPQSAAQTLALLAQAQAISTETKVRMANPEWDAEAVAAEVTRIHAETGQAVPDPVPNFTA